MKKNKNVISENYLERIPKHCPSITWKTDDDGIVTLEIANTGWANRIAQKIFKRPRISYIHLDKFGSFVWTVTDGKNDITELGKSVKEKFGNEAEPLYERLAQYFRILDSYHFIEWANKEQI